MSYLSAPQMPLHPGIEVPCEVVEDYDGMDLETYPRRKGWDNRTFAEWNQLFRSPTQAFRSFLQTWLFFGLIQQGLLPSPQVHSTKFTNLSVVLDNPPRTIIDMIKFKAMVEEWIVLKNSPSEPHALPVRVRSEAVKRAILAVVVVINCMERHDEHQVGLENNNHRCSLIDYLTNMPVKNPLHPAVTMSINLVLDILYAAIQLEPVSTRSTHRAVFTFKANRLTRWDSQIPKRMRNDGWCPYHISMLHERLNAAALCFASDFKRPSREKEHPMIHVRNSLASEEVPSQATIQGLCTHYRCAQTMLKPEYYETKHVEGCLGCQDMVADRETVHSILLKDHTFPLVLCIDEDYEGHDITLVEHSEEVKYIAISHVWSDGLGNLKRNALPRCQMLRLSKFVRNLSGEAHDIELFWIDTLCIPPDPIKVDDGEDDEVLNAQEVAITFMRQTYKDARAVLVLDSWLLAQPIKNQTPAEILIRILSSIWNTRLWTLQEGALAEILLFQFADTAYDSESGLAALLKDGNNVEALTLHTTIVQCFEDIRSLAWDNMTKPNLIALMHALKVRSTSVAGDEALCLAALMQLDLGEIVKAPVKERMHAFWSLLKEVPRAIIFYTGIKLQTPGYKWAPRSFLRPGNQSQDVRANLPVRSQHGEETGRVTSLGLEVELPGLDLHISWANAFMGMIFFCDNEGNYFEGALPTILNPDHLAGIFHQDHLPFVKIIEGTDNVSLDHNAMFQASAPFGVSSTYIDGRYVWILHIILQAKDALNYASVSGLLACPSTKQSVTNAINVNGICRLNIIRLGSEQRCAAHIAAMLNQPVDQLKRVKNGFEDTQSGRLLPVARFVRRESQVWCVD